MDETKETKLHPSLRALMGNRTTSKLALVLGAMAITAARGDIQLEYKDPKLHTLPSGDGEIQRLGVRPMNEELYLSMKLYRNKDGRLFPSVEFKHRNQQGEFVAPGHETHLWYGMPSKLEDKPFTLISALPLVQDSEIQDRFLQVIDQLNDPEVWKEAQDIGLVYSKKMGNDPQTAEELWAVCLPYALFSNPEITLIQSINQKTREIEFTVQPDRNIPGRLCFGPVPAFGTRGTQELKQGQKVPRLEGAATSKAAAGILQKMFDDAAKKLNVRLGKAPDRRSGRASLSEEFYEKSKTTNTTVGAENTEGVISPSL